MATTKVSNILEVRLAIGPVAFLVDLKLISSHAADPPNQESAFFETAVDYRLMFSIRTHFHGQLPDFRVTPERINHGIPRQVVRPLR